MSRALERKGWIYSRTRGSHFVYVRPGEPFSITIPVHGNDDLPTGTQRNIMKQAGLTDAEL